MKKMLITLTFICAVLMVNAQDKETRDAKREANKELNREARVGRNAGDNQKVNDAKSAKDRVKEAKSPGEVREIVRDYRTGNGGSSPNTGNRKPN